MDRYLTKMEMAQVIVQTLYHLRQLPAEDHPVVARVAKLNRVIVERQHKLALAAIYSMEKTQGQRIVL